MKLHFKQVISLFVLGLTGPSGTGKSYAAELFACAGFSIIDADSTARKVVEPRSPCLHELCEAFGSEIINSCGMLDRKMLAKKAFANKASLDKLNFITHPHIIKAINAELDALKQKGEGVAVLDAPALFESGADSVCDAVVTVTAPKALRLKRIMERDKLTEEQAKQRINAQPDDEYYTSRAAYVISNDGSSDAFTLKIEELTARIRKIV
jgi:dephospho-CoA kinase